jgi:hypothetical protein
LFGYAGLQRVEAVYIPNQFETNILWSGVVARDANWNFEFVEPVTVPAATIPQPAATPTADLARLKPPVNAAKSEDKKKQ